MYYLGETHNKVNEGSIMKREATIVFAYTAAIAALLIVGLPVHASEADAKTETEFEQSYVYRTYLNDDSIKADVKEGVVTLTGTAADESNKKLAQETAANLTGVMRVDNQLTTRAEDAAENADKWMGRKVKMALLFRRNVSGIGTSVEVNDGIVTLTGEADSEAQRQLTTEYAKDIEGVKDVRNQMTVAASSDKSERTAGEKLDDASVTAMVKSALATHRSTSAIKTGVVTRDGNVTVTGIARNEAEKALVTKLVDGIHGVNSVNNEMTINVAVSR